MRGNSTIKRGSKTESTSVSMRSCTQLITGQRNPVYTEMGCEVKASSWEKREPPPTLTLYITLLLQPEGQIEINENSVDQTQETVHRKMQVI